VGRRAARKLDAPNAAKAAMRIPTTDDFWPRAMPPPAAEGPGMLRSFLFQRYEVLALTLTAVPAVDSTENEY
jgi:hypothetical protein